MVELAVTLVLGAGFSAVVVGIWMLRAVRPRPVLVHREH
jgi:hypothetical protein